MRHGKDLKSDISTFQKAMNDIERAKIALSTEYSTEIEVDLGDLKISETLTRAKLEELCEDIFLNTLEHVKTALADAEVSIDDISEIVLVGGSSHIPKVKKLVHGLLGEFTVKVDPSFAVIEGMTRKAERMMSGNAEIIVCGMSVLYFPIGYEDSDGII